MDPNAAPFPILNRAALDEATGGDDELMQELAELYVTDADAQIIALATAVEAQDLDAVGRVAHGLKGSSASIGALEAAEAFRILEAIGRGADASDLGTALARARSALGRLRGELTTLRAA